MNNPSSPLDTLRQLKEMLDAGALTPTEFEALKKQLVFSNSAASPAPPAAEPLAPAPNQPVAGPSAPVPPVASPPVVPPMNELHLPLSSGRFTAEVPGGSAPRAAPGGAVESGPATPPGSFSVVSGPEPLPASPSEPVPAWGAREFPESETAAARSPLALILSIGGLLALLALVLYLSFNRPPSEHISSTSQTAADTLAAPIETGPQAEPLPPTVAVPETVRVTPVHPAPSVQAPTQAPAQPAQPPRDSATAVPPAAPDSTTNP